MRIATRESRLAMWQAEHVRGLLQRRFDWQVGLLGMTTDEAQARELGCAAAALLLETDGKAYLEAAASVTMC